MTVAGFLRSGRKDRGKTSALVPARSDPRPGGSRVKADATVPRWSIGLLTLVAVVAAIGGVALWPGFGSLLPQHQPSGGLIFAQAAAQGVQEDFSDKQTAGVQIDTWDTGTPNVSILSVAIEFDHPRVGSDWALIASGDFSVPDNRALSLYCKYGPGVRDGANVVCPAVLDNPQVRFRFDDLLGNALESNGPLFGVHDLEGYDPTDVTVLTGKVPRRDAGGISRVELYLPVSRIPVLQVGEDKRVSLPTIGLDSFTNYGQGDLISSKCSSVAAEPEFILSSHCDRVVRMPLTSIDLRVGVDVGTGYIESSSPDTVTDDELHWRVESFLSKPQAVIADPYSRQKESIRAFFAALIFGVAGSALAPIWGWLLRRRQSSNESNVGH